MKKIANVYEFFCALRGKITIKLFLNFICYET